MKPTILFLCTGNSCRSQMAEGWAKHLHPGKYQVFSAGTKKHGVNPRAMKVMAESGVDISSHQSKTTEELPPVTFDFVFTVCDNAHENCPFFPGGKIIHHSFQDPPRETEGMSNEEDILNVYRKVRDEIKTFVSNLDMYLVPQN